MDLVELPTASISAPSWNANELDANMRSNLREAIKRFSFLVPIVVRGLNQGAYETIGGAQRLGVLKEMGVDMVPCVVVSANDTKARLIAQSLNQISGKDNPGRKAELVRHLLAHMPEEEIIAVLPETSESLNALANLGQEGLAGYLQSWEEGRHSRLRRLQVWLTPAQLEVVARALDSFRQGDPEEAMGNPNPKGVALYRLCLAYEKLRRK